MAKQNSKPPEWHDSMSDGCSGVLDFGYYHVCVNHDRLYHCGGSVEDKLVADSLLYKEMCETPGVYGWLARHGWARLRYDGVRRLTYNYPPEHPMRSGLRVDAWNWLG